MYTEADEADELYYFTTHCVFFFRFMKRFKKFYAVHRRHCGVTALIHGAPSNRRIMHAASDV